MSKVTAQLVSLFMIFSIVVISLHAFKMIAAEEILGWVILAALSAASLLISLIIFLYTGDSQ